MKKVEIDIVIDFQKDLFKLRSEVSGVKYDLLEALDKQGVLIDRIYKRTLQREGAAAKVAYNQNKAQKGDIRSQILTQYQELQAINNAQKEAQHVA